MAGKVDWIKIRTDYINGGGSYRTLAEKYKISPTSVGKRAAKEGWTHLKKSQYEITSKKVAQKTAERVAEKEANRAVKLLAMADKLGAQIDRAIGELDRQIVKRKTRTRKVEYKDSGAPGKPTKETIVDKEDIEVAEGVIDRLGLQQISNALKNISDTIQALDGTGDSEGVQIIDDL